MTSVPTYFQAIGCSKYKWSWWFMWQVLKIDCWVMSEYLIAPSQKWPPLRRTGLPRSWTSRQRGCCVEIDQWFYSCNENHSPLADPSLNRVVFAGRTWRPNGRWPRLICSKGRCFLALVSRGMSAATNTQTGASLALCCFGEKARKDKYRMTHRPCKTPR